MGTPIPFPVPPNEPCACWLPGRPFDKWPQTLYVQATITEMIKGPNWTPPLPEPPNGLYELTETGPCFYALITVVYSVYWSYAFGDMMFKFDFGPNPNIFLDIKPGCHRDHENTNPHQPQFWLGGKAHIAWIGAP